LTFAEKRNIVEAFDVTCTVERDSKGKIAGVAVIGAMGVLWLNNGKTS
jgi:hypothetical protein